MGKGENKTASVRGHDNGNGSASSRKAGRGEGGIKANPNESYYWGEKDEQRQPDGSLRHHDGARVTPKPEAQ